MLMILLFIVLLLCMCLKRSKIKIPKTNIKIKMYGRDSCGYTVKMQKLINVSQHKNMFTYIDVNTLKGEIEYKKLNVKGVPTFQYKDKIVVGAMTLKQLFKKLNIE